jgi:hypothetical protein
MKISKNNTINNELNFKNVSEEFVTKQINKSMVISFVNDPGSPEIYTLTLNDALPNCKCSEITINIKQEIKQHKNTDGDLRTFSLQLYVVLFLVLY